MNTPGVSLFQGAEALKVNSTLERQEEEEALQDQKRREAEVSLKSTQAPIEIVLKIFFK